MDPVWGGKKNIMISCRKTEDIRLEDHRGLVQIKESVLEQDFQLRGVPIIQGGCRMMKGGEG